MYMFTLGHSEKQIAFDDIHKQFSQSSQNTHGQLCFIIESYLSHKNHYVQTGSKSHEE